MPTTAQMIEALVAMRHDPGGVPLDHFWQLVERFRAGLVNQAFAILGNQDDAEDCAQQSLAKTFRQLQSLKDPRRLGVWMRQINRRTALNLLRGRRREPVKAPALSAPEAAAPATTPTGRDLNAVCREIAVEQVARAVDELPEDFREVVVLRYWEHLPLMEIAVRLGLPEGTVKSRLARSDRLLLERLRRIWSEEPGR